MKKHTIYGADVVRSSENNSLRDEKGLFKIGIEIIEAHHEKL
jgi:response regulator RpfG family c-di-GMP phosphodiesterase